MHPNHLILLALVLVLFFCVFIGWFLYRCCSRAVDVEFAALQEEAGK
jgi:TRAP-type C4-dicarboxylate transport system permease small subunit